MRFKILACIAVLATIMGYAGTVYAVPVYTGAYTDMYLKQNTFPTGLNEQKVFLDATSSSTTVIGHVGSQTGTPLINFTSSDPLTAANGFATIKAADGTIFHDITITAPGYYFGDLIFSLNLAPNANMDLSISATDKSLGIDTFSNWTSQSAWVNGENDILVLSHTGNLMQSVTITSSSGIVGYGVDQLKQTQISDLTAIPEPTALLLLGFGLLCFAAVSTMKIKRA